MGTGPKRSPACGSRSDRLARRCRRRKETGDQNEGGNKRDRDRASARQSESRRVSGPTDAPQGTSRGPADRPALRKADLDPTHGLGCGPSEAVPNRPKAAVRSTSRRLTKARRQCGREHITTTGRPATVRRRSSRLLVAVRHGGRRSNAARCNAEVAVRPRRHTKEQRQGQSGEWMRRVQNEPAKGVLCRANRLQVSPNRGLPHRKARGGASPVRRIVSLRFRGKQAGRRVYLTFSRRWLHRNDAADRSICRVSRDRFARRFDLTAVDCRGLKQPTGDKQCQRGRPQWRTGHDGCDVKGR